MTSFPTFSPSRKGVCTRNESPRRPTDPWPRSRADSETDTKTIQNAHASAQHFPGRYRYQRESDSGIARLFATAPSNNGRRGEAPSGPRRRHRACAPCAARREFFSHHLPYRQLQRGPNHVRHKHTRPTTIHAPHGTHTEGGCPSRAVARMACVLKSRTRS